VFKSAPFIVKAHEQLKQVCVDKNQAVLFQYFIGTKVIYGSEIPDSVNDLRKASLRPRMQEIIVGFDCLLDSAKKSPDFNKFQKECHKLSEANTLDAFWYHFLHLSEVCVSG